MSGHSHFSTIKRKKEVTDKKRGQMFSRLARVITVAAKEKGGDPETNPGLRLAIEKAKEFNMPKDNIERAIKKGTGELAGEELHEVVFEAYGPGGTALIIEGITDNKNRTLGDIKLAISQHNGKLANEGSVRWMFERKGCITINLTSQNKNTEELELLAIDAGAQDVKQQGEMLDIYTNPDDLDKIRKSLAEKGIVAESTSLDWVAKEEISIDETSKKACEKLFEALDEVDAVQNIYSNLKTE